MIDIARFRADPEGFAEAWRHRGLDVDVAALADLDKRVRELKTEAESAKAEANAASKAIGRVAKDGGDINAARSEAKRLGDRGKELSEQRQELEDAFKAQILELPNPCLTTVPVGSDETGNVVTETWGSPATFAGDAKPHWELGPALDILDFERGAKLSGSGFVVYRGLGARLNRALISWFIDQLSGEHGYTELGVPYLVGPEAMQGTGQLPKFADQLYRCAEDELYLIPTAEVPVTNLHAGEIFDVADLPRRYCAHTPCFRREAGAAGVGTRGITRVHQFDKVEMVWLTTPERSDDDLMTMRGHAELMLQRLGLHYRVLELCTGDTGFSSAHTYDLEVWSPGTGSWLEVSSCSTFTDFQARRAGLRYRSEPGAKPSLLHTINGSGLALPRCVIALLETHQRSDGSVTVPEVLRPYLGGVEVIAPA
ncbi:MAG: serine--tRNA ligase [Planctomycetota bacterium]|jgi:seryl-tRNA synthetase|nr:serine--tRNA ligase [Planctomycetota bacterium]